MVVAFAWRSLTGTAMRCEVVRVRACGARCRWYVDLPSTVPAPVPLSGAVGMCASAAYVVGIGMPKAVPGAFKRAIAEPGYAKCGMPMPAMPRHSPPLRSVPALPAFLKSHYDRGSARPSFVFAEPRRARLVCPPVPLECRVRAAVRSSRATKQLCRLHPTRQHSLFNVMKFAREARLP